MPHRRGYDQTIGFVGGLNGDGTDTGGGDYSIAQHNLGILPVGSGIQGFRYPFQVFNGAGEEREFVVTARQAPLSELEPFQRGIPGGLKFMERPGKAEEVGAFVQPDREPADSKPWPAIPSPVLIKPHSSRMFALAGKLQRGNAFLHVTQTFRGRVVGGLSVLVMAEEK